MNNKFEAGYSDEYISIWWKKIPLNSRITFLTTFVMGVLTHMFVFSNKLVNGDDIGQLFDDMKRPFSGRWMLHVPAAISGRYSMPWINGILSVLYISLSAGLVVYILGVRRKVTGILIGAVMVTFPPVASTFSYMQSADGYFMGLLFMCIAVAAADKHILLDILAAAFICMSLGMYQAYFGMGVSLFVLLLLLGILDGKLKSLQIVKKGIHYVAILLSGLFLYMAVVWITTDGGKKLLDYQGISNMGKLDFEKIPGQIVEAIKCEYQFFLKNQWNIPLPYVGILYGVIVLLVFAELFFFFRYNKQTHRGSLLWFVLLAAIYPITANIIYLLGSEEVHFLMLYPLIMIWILALAIVDRLSVESFQKAWRWAVPVEWLFTAVVILSVGSYARIDNEAYFRMHLTYEQTYAYMNRLVARIQETDGYTTEMPVVFVGYPDKEKNLNPTPETSGLEKMTGIVSTDQLINIPVYHIFIGKYLNYPFRMYSCKSDPAKKLAGVDEVKKMPVYPDDGSILIYKDQVVVKMGRGIE